MSVVYCGQYRITPNLHAASRQAAYATWHATFWQLAERYFIDGQGGSWWHELDRHDRPAATIWAGKPDLYHALNATLLSLLPPTPSIAAQIAKPGT